MYDTDVCITIIRSIGIFPNSSPGNIQEFISNELGVGFRNVRRLLDENGCDASLIVDTTHSCISWTNKITTIYTNLRNFSVFSLLFRVLTMFSFLTINIEDDYTFLGGRLNVLEEFNHINRVNVRYFEENREDRNSSVPLLRRLEKKTLFEQFFSFFIVIMVILHTQRSK